MLEAAGGTCIRGSQTWGGWSWSRRNLKGGGNGGRFFYPSTTAENQTAEQDKPESGRLNYRSGAPISESAHKTLSPGNLLVIIPPETGAQAECCCLRNQFFPDRLNTNLVLLLNDGEVPSRQTRR